jgi:hypothetical protein
LQKPGRLFYAQAAEVSQFDNLAIACEVHWPTHQSNLLSQAVAASLRLLELMPDIIGFPLLAATCNAKYHQL